MDRIKQKRQRFNALLHYAMLKDAKPYILESFGVSSTLDLTEKQLDDAISRVQKIADEKQTAADLTIREWRHKCLRMMADCDVNTQDWNAVNAFMMDKRICGKHLYELTLPELHELHRKLHNVKANMEAKKLETQRLQILN